MERPIMKPIGTPVQELDTPALVVDLDILETNIADCHAHFQLSDTKIRPHIQAHLSPAIAHMQIHAQGTMGGIAVSTLGQAEIFAQRGFHDILITNLAVTAPKIARVAALSKRTNLTVCADDPGSALLLAHDVALALSTVSVMVVARDQDESIGVTPQNVADTVSMIKSAVPLRFAGFISSSASVLLEAASNYPNDEIETVLALPEGEGMPDSTSGITQIVTGSYALMDAANQSALPDMRPAANILATVMTHQEEGLVWLDAGQKATSIDTGLPLVDGIPGASVSRMSAEHGGMVLDEGATWDVDIGTKVRLIPHNIANTVNVYDFIHAVRDGKLEAVWEVAARGRYD